jgi:hypothetical protein
MYDLISLSESFVDLYGFDGQGSGFCGRRIKKREYISFEL